MKFLCRIADLNLSYDVPSERLSVVARMFAENFDKADIELIVTQDDIDKEKNIFLKENNKIGKGSFELTATFRVLAEKLPRYDAVVLHACSFSVGKKGIALAAHSGTGKTTHMLLWREMLKDKFQIINGDKPIIRIIDNIPYLYGSPWAGKEALKANIRTPLTDICEIIRSDKNYIEPMSKEEAIDLLFRQIYMPFDTMMKLKTFKLIENIVEKVVFWKIHCNMEPEAAEVAYNTIINGTSSI